MRFHALAAVTVALVASMGDAQAHASLDRADPRVVSTVASAPRALSLWFSQKVEPAFSTVEVRDAAGARVDQGKPHGGGNVLQVGLRSLPVGTYNVHWRVLSVDTHITEGSFSFQVGQ